MPVLMVINTAGLQYDDRLRKEVLSLQDLGRKVEILGLEYANRSGRTTVYDAVPATAIRLWSRGWFTRGRGVAVKTLEMYVRFLAAIMREKRDIVWCHNLELGGLVPVLAILRACGRIRQIIWDQHELPADSLLRNRAYKALYLWLTARCDRVVMANRERRDLVAAWSGGSVGERVDVLENLPDSQFATLPVEPLPSDASRWLNGSPYFLAQGGANPDRHLASLVAAVLHENLPKLIVVGPYSQRQIEDLEAMHGSDFKARVLFTGAVPQMKLTPFIDHAVASIVLYEMNSENTRLCAPNRLYQALSRGVPVVVGSNPPMADLVRGIDCGVVLRTDGADVNDVRAGLRMSAARRQRLSTAGSMRRHLAWESQAATIGRLVMIASNGERLGTISNETRLPVTRFDRR